MVFNMDGIIAIEGAAAKGKTLQVISVSATQNDRGDHTKSKTAYSIDGVIQIMTTEEDEVMEGLLSPGDIIGWVSETATNKIYLVPGNELFYDGKYYRIKDIIENSGHIEVMCKKI